MRHEAGLNKPIRKINAYRRVRLEASGCVFPISWRCVIWWVRWKFIVSAHRWIIRRSGTLKTLIRSRAATRPILILRDSGDGD